MSQGDATFNATLKIKVLLRELALCKQPGSGYDDGDAAAIVEAIDIIRKRADALEMNWVASPPEGESRPGAQFVPLRVPPYPYQQPNTITSIGGVLQNGLGFSGD